MARRVARCRVTGDSPSGAQVAMGDEKTQEAFDRQPCMSRLSLASQGLLWEAWLHHRQCGGHLRPSAGASVALLLVCYSNILQYAINVSLGNDSLNDVASVLHQNQEHLLERAP